MVFVALWPCSYTSISKIFCQWNSLCFSMPFMIYEKVIEAFIPRGKVLSFVYK